MAFLYSSNDMMWPIFVRKVFGHNHFVSNTGFLWLSYPVGSVLITILVKTLFETIHNSGLLVFISFFQFLSFYAAHAMKKSHKNDLLKQVETINMNTEEDSQEGNENHEEPNTVGSSEINLPRRTSKAVLSL